MKTLWIGMIAVAFVLGTPVVGVAYILGKWVFDLKKINYVPLKLYLKAVALASGSAFFIAFFR